MQRRLVVIAVVGCMGWGAKSASAQSVSYEKYTLDNGMTVILHEDHSLPVAAVNIWYYVGSKDEPARRSGFAHLFEHLMFMGTKRVPGNEFDVIMESAGGSNNASTSSDRTNYFSSGPASLLPTLLWLDADRLEDLARMMDQAKLDKQRDVVRNERRQSYENQPYGKAELRIQEMMYPPGHPYHIPVIGTHEDLEAATVADVKNFFATYYWPNNASLCVAGDFDAKQIKPLIAALFGNLTRGLTPPHADAMPVKLDAVKRETMVDQVQLPKVAMAFHSPASYKDGEAEMELVGMLLSAGKTSRLYKRLVYEDKIASDVRAYQDSSQLGSVFRIDVIAQLGIDLDRVEGAIDEEVAKLLDKGPTADELEKHKAAVELDMLTRLENIENKADQLNEYEYFFKEPNSFQRDLDRFRKATVAGVQKWARDVLTPNARVVMRILPEAPERGDSPRDARPSSMAGRPFLPPAPQTFKLSNGIPVMLWRKPELPLVAASILVRGRGALDTPQQAGAASLTANMLDEGAGDLDALAFGDAIRALGAEFETSAERESFDISLTVLKRNFERAASLMADAVQRPRFDEKEWERIKRLHLEELKQEQDEPRTVASNVAARLFFGDRNPFGWPISGTADTVQTLELGAIRNMHKAAVRPDATTIFVSGDITLEEAKSTLERVFGAWSGSGSGPVAAMTYEPVARDRLAVAIVHRPDAVQTVVRFIAPGPAFGDGHRAQYRLLNTLFGGSFTSRLNQNLREEHGYTYGARSNFTMEPSAGYFTAGSSVKADVTGPSVAEFLKEFGRIQRGDITAEESNKARETLATETIQTFAGLSGVLEAAAELAAAGLPYETMARDVAAMQLTKADDLNALGRQAMPIENGVLVLVGDKKVILPQLEGLDLPAALEVNTRGEPVASK